MGTSVYTQAEVDALIAMKKRVDHKDWESPKDSRPTPGVISSRVKAVPVEQGMDAEFVLESSYNDAARIASHILHAKLPNKPIRPICRYDVQLNAHKNGTMRAKKFCGNGTIAPREPHRHVYNAKAVAALGLEDWDVCAEPINAGQATNFGTMKNLLVKAFLRDMNVTVETQDQYDMFNDIQP